MDEDGDLRTYTVRAINPKLEPSMVQESCPKAEAADAQGQATIRRRRVAETDAPAWSWASLVSPRIDDRHVVVSSKAVVGGKARQAHDLGDGRRERRKSRKSYVSAPQLTALHLRVRQITPATPKIGCTALINEIKVPRPQRLQVGRASSG